MKSASVCIVRFSEPSFGGMDFISRYPSPESRGEILVVREWLECDRFVLCLSPEENPYGVELCILYKPLPRLSSQIDFVATGQGFWKWCKKEFLRIYFCKLVGMCTYPEKNFREAQKSGKLVSQANLAAQIALWDIEVTDVISAPLAESDPFS